MILSISTNQWKKKLQHPASKRLSSKSFRWLKTCDSSSARCDCTSSKDSSWLSRNRSKPGQKPRSFEKTKPLTQILVPLSTHMQNNICMEYLTPSDLQNKFKVNVSKYAKYIWGASGVLSPFGTYLRCASWKQLLKCLESLSRFVSKKKRYS